ncbi:COX assembly mitochondrial protein homolog isoform X1 [Numenius arquata]|uniref:COX assembly mitochondrial protein homolog isoform X1 n=1 Tax=Numenius arquata TaxID=31919 RepID=UPI003D305301
MEPAPGAAENSKLRHVEKDVLIPQIMRERAKELCSDKVQGSLQILEGCYEVSLEPSLLQAEEPQLSQSVFTGEVLHPSDHLRGPPPDLFRQVLVLPVFRTPELDTVLQHSLSAVKKLVFLWW